MNGFDRLNDNELRDAILAVKAAFIRLEDVVVSDLSKAPQAQFGSTIQLAVIEQLETELRSRGFDPSNEIFGRDILGEIIQLKLEDANGRMDV